MTNRNPRLRWIAAVLAVLALLVLIAWWRWRSRQWCGSQHGARHEIAQRHPHRLLHRTFHRITIPEADFELGRMHVHVDHGGIDLYVEKE